MTEPLNATLFRLASIILILGLGIFGMYEYQVSKGLEAQVQGIRNQVATLALSSGTTTPVVSLTSAVAKVTPAVVSIIISEDIPKVEVHYENPFGNNPSFRDYSYRIPVFRQIGTEKQTIGAGSGFLVRSDGYIVTNKHVVGQQDVDYTVLLSTGKEVPAKVVYIDPTNDIAIIKIPGAGYPFASLGDSSTLALGETVAAIGNALGEYNNTVSTGIISGLNRNVEAQDTVGNTEILRNVIQTDAAVNLGNSGGPLIDLEGRVVGVNVATVVGSNSIAFSIPINVVKTIVNKVL